MNTFQDAQNKASVQMEASQKEAELREITKDLSQAARDLATTNQNQLMQMQQHAQQSSMQTQSINNLSAAVSSSQGMGGRIAQAAQPAVNMAGTVASVGAGMMGSHLGNRAEQVRSKSMDFFHRYNTMNNRGMPGAQPGFLGIPNNGMGSSIFHGSGLSWNPASAHNYTFGAYQRAAAYNIGTNTEAYARSAIMGGLGMMSMENLGGMAGGLVPGLGGFIASPALGMLGKGLDVLNPISYGIKQSGRAAAFGATSAPDAYQFLRGSGLGQSVGSLGIEQQARIGIGVQKLAQKDMMYSNEDIMGLQTQFAQTGQFLGVQGAEQYERRMKKLLDTHKSIMKTLQVTTDEAMGIMDEMFSTIGVDHGAEMSQLMTRMYSSAHLSGVSPQDMMRVGIQGGRMGIGAGLMSSTGARMAMSARGLAGLSATNVMPTNLLATVGGEEGLGNMIARQNMQFAGGTGGTLMALTGGNLGGSVQEALSRATSNIQGGGDIVNLLANKHSMMDKMSPELIQAQNANMLSSMAQQMGSGMGSVKDRMKLLLQSRGMSPAEADAYVRSLEELPNQMQKERVAQMQARNDQMSDAFAEQHSIRGRITYGYRDFQESAGGNRIMSRINMGAARIGEAAEITTQNFFDRLSGADDRVTYNTEGANRIRDRVKRGENVFGGGSTVDDDGAMEVVDKMRALNQHKRGQWSGTFFGSSTADNINREMKDAIESGSVEKVKNIVRAVRSGQSIESGADLAFTTDTGEVSDGAAYAAMQEAAKHLDVDKDKMRAMAEGMGIDQDTPNVMDAKQRRKYAMDRFGPQKSGVGRFAALVPSSIAGGVFKLGARIGVEAMDQNMFGVKSQDMEYSIGNKKFQEIILEADKLYKEAQKAKSGDTDIEATEGKIREHADRIGRMYNQIQDNKIKDTIRKTLRAKGIEIKDDGEVDAGGLLDKVQDGDLKGKGLFGDTGEVRGLFKAVDDAKDLEQANLAIREGYSMALSEAGISTSGLNIDIDTSASGRRQEFKMALKNLNEEEIKKLSEGNSNQQKLAKLATILKQGKSGKNVDQSLKNVLQDIGVAGLAATEGATYYGKGIDKDKIGASVTTDMAITTANIQQTVVLLNEVTKRMEES